MYDVDGIYHDIDYSEIDELDEKDDGQQLCRIWCHTHEEYEWHWLDQADI